MRLSGKSRVELTVKKSFRKSLMDQNTFRGDNIEGTVENELSVMNGAKIK